MSEVTGNTDGAFIAVQDEKGVRFERVAPVEKTGEAVIEAPRSKSRRQLEMELGRQRVEEAAFEVATRPRMEISDAEKRAMGYNIPVFRPNMLSNDRVVAVDGRPVDQSLGAQLRSRLVSPMEVQNA